jgi:hypothetical protein
MGLVGFYPHHAPGLPQWADELLECRSGLYINSLELINPENLTAAMKKMAVTQYPEWEAKVYRRNAVVRVGTVLFTTDATTQATDNPVAGAPWRPTNPLSIKLRYVMDAAVAEVANALANANKLAGAKTVVEDTKLYVGAGNINSRIVKTSRFVGFEIVVKQVRDLAIRLRSVGIQVDTPNPDLAIYVYHTSSSTPIKVLKPGFAGSGTFAWAAVADALLTLESEAYAPGGSFLVGYYEDDVVGQMIARETGWPNYDLPAANILGYLNCGKCNPDNYNAVKAWSQYVEIHPFTVPFAELNEARELWNMERVQYNYNSNYGLNLDVAVECDVTQFLKNNEQLLADALHKVATVRVLEIFTSSIEDNPLAEQARQAAAYNLENRDNYTPGLIKKMDAALKGLSLELATGSPCAPAQATNAPAVYEITSATV